MKDKCTQKNQGFQGLGSQQSTPTVPNLLYSVKSPPNGPNNRTK